MSACLTAASIIVSKGPSEWAQGFAKGCLNCEFLTQVSEIIVGVRRV